MYTKIASIFFPALKQSLTTEEAAQLNAAVTALDALNAMLPSPARANALNIAKREKGVYLKNAPCNISNDHNVTEHREADLERAADPSCNDELTIRPLTIRKHSPVLPAKQPSKVRLNSGRWLAGTVPNPMKRVPSYFSIHDFHITRFLGGGSQGKVYKAAYKEKPEHYAIKVVNRRKLDDHEVERVIREQKILKKLKGGPFVMDIIASFHDAANFYLVTAFYGGKDLQEVLLSWTQFDLERTRFYTAEIILGLQFIHDRGICHRDLKLSNVLLTADGHVALADFGLSSDESIPETKPTFCGTAAFMSPEVLTRRALPGRSSDVWSLGVCIWTMRSGQVPWYIPGDIPATKQAIIEHPLPNPNGYEGGFEAVIYDLCKLILNKDHRTRPTLSTLGKHQFFSGADWNAIAQQVAEAPWLPAEDDENVTLAAQLLEKHQCTYLGNKEGNDTEVYPEYAYVAPEFPLEPATREPVGTWANDNHASWKPFACPRLEDRQKDHEASHLSGGLSESPSLRLALFKFPGPVCAARRQPAELVDSSMSSSELSNYSFICWERRTRSSTSYGGDVAESTESTSAKGPAAGPTSTPDRTPNFFRRIVDACKQLLSYRH